MNTDQMAKAKSLAEARGCFTCHQVAAKVVGPAFAWVAYKFKGDPKAVATLSHAIEHGVAGVWVSMPMPPQRLTPAEAKELASWVLAQKPIAPPKSA
jgi:cytochrome c